MTSASTDDGMTVQIFWERRGINVTVHTEEDMILQILLETRRVNLEKRIGIASEDLQGMPGRITIVQKDR